MSDRWIAERMQRIDASGIRKVFDMAASLTETINLSIGQPHFDTPQPVRDALVRAVADGRNGYSPSPGIAPLIEALQAGIDSGYGHEDRQVFITSGTSGGLMLALCSLVNPGDEVIVFDPSFTMYRHLATLAGGTTVPVETDPDFRIDLNRLHDAITERTKLIVCNSPCNPTGVVATNSELRTLAELADEHDIALLSDEIYHTFCYDRPFVSPAQFNERTIVVDGFSKSHSMTGWRLGFAHGPRAIIQEMIKLQQFTFVCAPQPVQWAGLAALDVDVTDDVESYRRKRDFVLSELRRDFDIRSADGAFYIFARPPWGRGSEFVAEAIRQNLLIIPGNVFSAHDTHIRISYAVDDETLERGVDVLKRLARRGP